MIIIVLVIVTSVTFFFSGPEVADSLGNNAPKRKIINDASDKESKCEYFTVITIFKYCRCEYMTVITIFKYCKCEYMTVMAIFKHCKFEYMTVIAMVKYCITDFMNGNNWFLQYQCFCTLKVDWLSGEVLTCYAEGHG